MADLDEDTCCIGTRMHKAEGSGVTIGSSSLAASTAARRLAIINGPALAELVTMGDAVELMTSTMRVLSDGAVIAPERWTMPVSDAGLLGLMPGVAPRVGRFGVKVLSIFENAADNNLPGHQGIMLLLDLETGAPLSIIDANALTGLRTAAASAVATRALAREDSSVLAILGCGERGAAARRGDSICAPDPRSSHLGPLSRTGAPLCSTTP